MLIAGLLIVVSLSPVRGPGPRASRLEAMVATVGQRARLAVLIAPEHEDAALSLAVVKRSNASVEAWILPEADHAERYDQFKALAYAVRRAYDAGAAWTVWANDHTFLIAENLACYLRTLDARTPVYAGMRMWGPCCGLFNSGAAGFALSRRAAALLVGRWAEIDADPTLVDEECDPRRPEAHVAACLVGLDPAAAPIDARDGDGAERFSVYGPVRLALGAVDEWLVKKKQNMHPPETLARDGSAVATDAVSFHYAAAAEKRLLHALLHEDRGLVDAGDAAARLSARWPAGRAELGGYSFGWPGNRQKADRVVSLLRRLRVCEAPPAALFA